MPPACHRRTLELRVQSAAALAALTVALSAWVQSDGAEQLPELVDRAFLALRQPPWHPSG